MSYNSPYSSTKGTTSNTTVKKRTLKDNSWIRHDGDDSFDSEEETQPMYKTGSVSNLTKRFGGSQDLVKSNTSPAKTRVIDPSSSVKTSSTTTTTTTKTETKTATPSKPSLPSKPALSPVKTSFTDRVFSANKTSTQQYSSPSKTTTVTTSTTKNTPDGKTTTVTTTTKETTNGISVKTSSPTSPIKIKTSVESTPKSPAPVSTTSTLDNLADTLIDIPTKTSDSTSVKNSYSSTRKSTSDTPKTTQKQTEVNSISGSNLDQLADTLDPFPSSIPPPPSVKAPTSPSKNWSDSLLSPTETRNESYETSYTKSTKYSPGDQLIYSSTSPSVQSLSKRSLSDRNLCSFCHQPITDSIRMIMEELNIFSHDGCFRCAVCHRKLSNLMAGDSLWVYRDAINCDDCYQKLRDRWFQ